MRVCDMRVCDMRVCDDGAWRMNAAAYVCDDDNEGGRRRGCPHGHGREGGVGVQQERCGKVHGVRIWKDFSFKHCSTALGHCHRLCSGSSRAMRWAGAAQGRQPSWMVGIARGVTQAMAPGRPSPAFQWVGT